MNDYKIFFRIEKLVLFVSNTLDNLEPEWSFNPEEAMEFDQQTAQTLVDILQDKYPDITIETSFFLHGL
jgi:hypothetical protein